MPKCWICGKEAQPNMVYPSNRSYCPKCEAKANADKKEMLNKYLEFKIRIAYERALRILEKQQADIWEYQEAGEVVLEKALSDFKKFGSSDEMVACMELIKNHIRTKLQVQIGKHRVDFMLPELKVVLEIDGYMHKGKSANYKDCKRDIDIRQSLGADWEVVRIPTKYVEQNVKQLLPAIKKMKVYQQDLRKKNNGLLPDWYSDRDKVYMQNKLKVSDNSEEYYLKTSEDRDFEELLKDIS